MSVQCQTRIRSLASISYRSRHYYKLLPSPSPARPAFQPRSAYPSSFIRTHSDSPVVPPTAIGRDPKLPNDAEELMSMYEKLYTRVYGATDTHPEARAALEEFERLLNEHLRVAERDNSNLHPAPRESALSVMRDPTLQVAATKAIVAFRDAGIAWDLTLLLPVLKAWGGLKDEDTTEPVPDTTGMERDGNGEEGRNRKGA